MQQIEQARFYFLDFIAAVISQDVIYPGQSFRVIFAVAAIADRESLPGMSVVESQIFEYIRFRIRSRQS